MNRGISSLVRRFVFSAEFEPSTIKTCCNWAVQLRLVEAVNRKLVTNHFELAEIAASFMASPYGYCPPNASVFAE